MTNFEVSKIRIGSLFLWHAMPRFGLVKLKKILILETIQSYGVSYQLCWHYMFWEPKRIGAWSVRCSISFSLNLQWLIAFNLDWCNSGMLFDVLMFLGCEGVQWMGSEYPKRQLCILRWTLPNPRLFCNCRKWVHWPGTLQLHAGELLCMLYLYVAYWHVALFWDL